MRELTALSNAIFSPDGFNFLGVLQETGRLGRYATTRYAKNCDSLQKMAGKIIGLLCGPSALKKWSKVGIELHANKPLKATRVAVKALADSATFGAVLIAYNVITLSAKSTLLVLQAGAWFDLGAAVVDLARYQALEKNPEKNHMVRVAKRIDACIRLLTKMLALTLISTSLPLYLSFMLLETVSMIGIDYFRELRKQKAAEVIKT